MTGLKLLVEIDDTAYQERIDKALFVHIVLSANTPLCYAHIQLSTSALNWGVVSDVPDCPSCIQIYNSSHEIYYGGSIEWPTVTATPLPETPPDAVKTTPPFTLNMSEQSALPISEQPSLTPTSNGNTPSP